jgi:hypothetical protein
VLNKCSEIDNSLRHVTWPAERLPKPRLLISLWEALRKYRRAELWKSENWGAITSLCRWQLGVLLAIEERTALLLLYSARSRPCSAGQSLCYWLLDAQRKHYSAHSWTETERKEYANKKKKLTRGSADRWHTCTSRKITGSNPDGVIRFSIRCNPSNCNMAWLSL